METIQSLYKLFEDRGFPGHMAPKVSRHVNTTGLVWRFTSAGVVFDRDCRASVGVYDQHNIPQAGVTVRNVTVAGHVEREVTGSDGRANFFMGHGSGYSQPNQGPHTISVEGAPSDQVVGIGLPNGHHADFGISFQLRRDDPGNGDDNGEDPGNGEEPQGCLTAIFQIIKRSLVGG